MIDLYATMHPLILAHSTTPALENLIRVAAIEGSHKRFESEGEGFITMHSTPLKVLTVWSVNLDTDKYFAGFVSNSALFAPDICFVKTKKQ